MSKEGIIVINIPEIPENCSKCKYINKLGTCKYTGLHIIELAGIKRDIRCPIIQRPKKRTIKEDTSIIGTYIRKYAEGYNDCIDEILGGK